MLRMKKKIYYAFNKFSFQISQRLEVLQFKK